MNGKGSSNWLWSLHVGTALFPLLFFQQVNLFVCFLNKILSMDLVCVLYFSGVLLPSQNVDSQPVFYGGGDMEKIMMIFWWSITPDIYIYI